MQSFENDVAVPLKRYVHVRDPPQSPLKSIPRFMRAFNIIALFESINSEIIAWELRGGQKTESGVKV